ncbi:hypothetical protein VTL71DRAFT_13447 [Oculimacula yallundae]|uniref:Uncharacterized protein n=1 Tax=Oculimacula yallundae TaxID=86028 RepID=A0ABR4CKC7_9HELO
MIFYVILSMISTSRSVIEKDIVVVCNTKSGLIYGVVQPHVSHQPIGIGYQIDFCLCIRRGYPLFKPLVLPIIVTGQHSQDCVLTSETFTMSDEANQPLKSYRSFCDDQLCGAQLDLDHHPPAYENSWRYFVEHGQHSTAVQSLCERMNIQLPFQKHQVCSWTMPFWWLLERYSTSQKVSLIPYMRRLVCTGNDTDAILEKFFGSCFSHDVQNLRKQERRNYLLTAKSATWDVVKSAYDLGSEEKVPYLAPLRAATEEEILDAERHWSEWLAMEDWMLGPRRPLSLDFYEKEGQQKQGVVLN